MKKFFLIGLINLLVIELNGQDLIFKNYSIEDGLPSSEVHDIYQDARGYMWFATDRGIARFDGEDFKVYNTINGLRENCVFNFFEETPERVWFADKLNHLYCFNPLYVEFKPVPFPLNHELQVLFSEKVPIEFIRRCWLDDSLSLCTSFLTGAGYLRLNRNGSGNLISRIYAYQYTNISNEFDLVIHLNTIAKTCYTSLTPIDSNIGSHTIYFKDDVKDEMIPVGLEYSYQVRWLYGVSDFQYYNEAYYFLVGRYLFSYDQTKGLSYVQLPSEGLRFVLSESGILVATFRGLLHVTEKGQVDVTSLESNTITAVFRDGDNGVWVSTLDEGVYYSRSESFFTYANLPTKKIIPRAIFVDSSWIACPTDKKTVEFIDRQGRIVKSSAKVDYYHELFLTTDLTLAEYLGEPRPHWYLSNLYTYFWGGTTGNKDLIDVNRTGLIVDTKDSTVHRKLKIPYMNDYFSVNDSTILLATDSGLYCLKNLSDLSKVAWAKEFGNVSMQKITPFLEGYLISSSGSGLIYVDSTQSINLNATNGLISDFVTDMVVANDSAVWIASFSGLMKLSYSSESKRIKTNIVGINEGLPSNEITCLTLFNDTVWVGTKRGICFFKDENKDALHQFNPAYFQLDSVLIDGQNQPSRSVDTIQLNFDDSLELFFNQLAYYTEDPMFYEYRFREKGEDWTKLNRNSLLYVATESGFHTIEIKPVCKTCQSKLTIVIHVHAPFWHSWWFYLITLIFFGVLLWLLAKIIVYRKTLKKEKEIDKLKLEMRALLSQMNPHFTFNTINAIQHYLINHSTKEAVLYLADFALLIRKTLEFSDLEYIHVREELDFLKLYTDLENKRFNRNFQVLFLVQLKSSAGEVKIPALLIQPLVENAIIHGISQKAIGEGKITISILEEDTHFMIGVEDNGKGIHPTAPVLNRKSYGIEILRNRLKLYNGNKYHEHDLSISSVDETQSPTGTTVKIKLYKLRHESNNS